VLFDGIPVHLKRVANAPAGAGSGQFIT